MKVKILANKNWKEDQTRICIQSKQRNLSTNDNIFSHRPVKTSGY